VADGANDIFVLAIVLAIDAIHDERREQGNRRRAGGIGGMIGGNFP
jgi:hypothetical protein